MSRRRVLVVALLAAGLAVGLVVAFLRRGADVAESAPCAVGFERHGPRCCLGADRCSALARPSSCAAPFVVTVRGCDLPSKPIVDVVFPTKVTIGPSDWEAEGRVEAMTIETKTRFAIDRYEVTVGRFCGWHADAPFCATSDAARAAFGVTLDEARAFCMQFPRGHLPTETEWLAVAAGSGTIEGRGEKDAKGEARPRRYPWGDTGAVCRRVAFGLETGPCGRGADGPDTVGAHPDGATPLGVQDLAGNVEEWVELDAGVGAGKAAVRGGSWKTSLATELRTWLRREESSTARLPTIGFRCAYGLETP